MVEGVQKWIVLVQPRTCSDTGIETNYCLSEWNLSADQFEEEDPDELGLLGCISHQTTPGETHGGIIGLEGIKNGEIRIT